MMHNLTIISSNIQGLGNKLTMKILKSWIRQQKIHIDILFLQELKINEEKVKFQFDQLASSCKYAHDITSGGKMRTIIILLNDWQILEKGSKEDKSLD